MFNCLAFAILFASLFGWEHLDKLYRHDVSHPLLPSDSQFRKSWISKIYKIVKNNVLYDHVIPLRGEQFTAF